MWTRYDKHDSIGSYLFPLVGHLILIHEFRDRTQDFLVHLITKENKESALISSLLSKKNHVNNIHSLVTKSHSLGTIISRILPSHKCGNHRVMKRPLINCMTMLLLDHFHGYRKSDERPYRMSQTTMNCSGPMQNCSLLLTWNRLGDYSERTVGCPFILQTFNAVQLLLKIVLAGNLICVIKRPTNWAFFVILCRHGTLVSR